jgi:aminoglycoside/choline kinase family phosphotransferase
VNLRAAAIERFLADAGWADAARRPLGADWSNRHYQRLRRGNGGTAILMDSGDDAPVGPFLAVGAWLRSVGLHAPEVFASDETSRLALLEDLGDDLLARVVERGGDEAALYRLALDAILHFQDATPPTFLPVMDEAGLLALLDVYLDFAIPPTSGDERAEFAAAWGELLPLARTGPDVFLYRDYHAENLLLLPSGSGVRRLGLLDFQDAFRGPAAYDVVSLVQDARRDVSPAVAGMVVDAYLAARPGLERERLELALAVLGAQRAMRILGVVGRLMATRGRVFPAGMRRRVRGHLEASLAHPALDAAARLVRPPCAAAEEATA